MIRFVDLRGQGVGYRFAFWSTTIDRFVQSEAGDCAWDTFAQFEEAMSIDEAVLARFRGLTPAWAFEDGEDDVISWYVDVPTVREFSLSWQRMVLLAHAQKQIVEKADGLIYTALLDSVS